LGGNGDMLALFYEDGLYGKEYILRAGDTDDIQSQLLSINSWLCVCNNGRIMGPKEDQEQLNKLEDFLTKKINRSAIKDFYISVSTGTMGCELLAETKEEFENLAEIIMIAGENNNQNLNKVEALANKVVMSITEESALEYLERIYSRRQYLFTGIATEVFIK